MKEIVEKLSKKSNKNFLYYCAGLILCPTERSCSSVGELFKKSHDKFQRLFKIKKLPDIVKLFLIKLVHNQATFFKGYLIIDDVIICKMFSHVIAGTAWFYYKLLGKEVKAINIVVIAWTNGAITIPLGLRFYYPEAYVGKDKHKTKNELAKDFILKWRHKVPFYALIADGHSLTKGCLLPFLFCCGIKFVMKVARNKTIK